MPHKNQNVFTITYKHNLVTHENFVQFCSSIQKLFMIFCYTDGQTDRHTDGQTHKLHTKWITPLSYMGTGGIFIPHFYLSQNAHSDLFR